MHLGIKFFNRENILFEKINRFEITKKVNFIGYLVHFKKFLVHFGSTLWTWFTIALSAPIVSKNISHIYFEPCTDFRII